MTLFPKRAVGGLYSSANAWLRIQKPSPFSRRKRAVEGLDPAWHVRKPPHPQRGVVGRRLRSVYVVRMLHGGLPGCRASRAYRLRGSPAQPRATTFSIAFETFCRRAGSASATAAPRPLRHHPPPRSRSRPAPGRVVCRRRKAPRSSTCPHRRPQGLSPEPLPIDGSRHQAMLSPPKVAA